MVSQIGSGALPVAPLASHGLAFRPKSPHASLNRLQQRLRELPRPVLGRIADDTLWLDLRCLEESEEAELVRQFQMLVP
jgi:L-seryl-tRNA(Ser) seleniumtransferase